MTQTIKELAPAAIQRLSHWITNYGKEKQKPFIEDLTVVLAMAQSANNPCSKIFDHKWLDPVCVEGGCQSLKIKPLDATGIANIDSIANEFVNGGKSVDQLMTERSLNRTQIEFAIRWSLKKLSDRHTVE